MSRSVEAASGSPPPPAALDMKDTKEAEQHPAVKPVPHAPRWRTAAERQTALIMLLAEARRFQRSHDHTDHLAPNTPKQHGGGSPRCPPRVSRRSSSRRSDTPAAPPRHLDPATLTRILHPHRRVQLADRALMSILLNDVRVLIVEHGQAHEDGNYEHTKGELAKLGLWY